MKKNVLFLRSSIEYTWNAEIRSGSHILFEWFINSELAMATTRAKVIVFGHLISVHMLWFIGLSNEERVK